MAITGKLPSPDKVLDTGPEGCGGLLMFLLREIRQMQRGQVLEVISYDLGAVEDIPAWCRLQGHTLIATVAEAGRTRFFIRRSGGD